MAEILTVTQTVKIAKPGLGRSVLFSQTVGLNILFKRKELGVA